MGYKSSVIERWKAEHCCACNLDKLLAIANSTMVKIFISLVAGSVSSPEHSSDTLHLVERARSPDIQLKTVLHVGQPPVQVRDKIWEWPEDKATCWVLAVIVNFMKYTMYLVAHLVAAFLKSKEEGRIDFLEKLCE